jgi:hypothetical protein
VTFYAVETLIVVAGWLLINQAYGTKWRRMTGRRTGEVPPWNWRLMVSPWFYYSWLLRGQHRGSRHYLQRFGQWLGLVP